MAFQALPLCLFGPRADEIFGLLSGGIMKAALIIFYFYSATTSPEAGPWGSERLPQRAKNSHLIEFIE